MTAEDNYHRSISPLQELRFLDAMMADSELPMTARVVGFRLVRWTSGKKDHRYHGHAWAGREKIAEWVGRDSKTTISTATNALRARGWIITKRRRNETNLVRPNWSRVDQILQEDQKTVFPGDQFSIHPEVQKTGPYSADRYSADHDSADQEVGDSGQACADRNDVSSVDRDAAPTAPSAGSDDQKPALPNYQQGKTEADEVYKALRGLPWPEEFEVDGECKRLSPRTRTAAIVHWHRLLRSGVSAGQIYRAALKHLDEYPQFGRLSLAGFLSKPAHFTFDPEEPDMFIEVDEDRNRRFAANNNQPAGDPANDNLQPDHDSREDVPDPVITSVSRSRSYRVP